MIPKLMVSSAVLALMAVGTFGVAQAQTEPATQPPAALEEELAAGAGDAAAIDATEMMANEATLKPNQPTIATAFIGRDVYSSEDPESDIIGKVNDLIINDDGAITHAVIGVGGFLGIGQKGVAVPFDELEVFKRDGKIRLVYASTREQLEAAEEFDRTAFDPWARWAEQQAAMQPDMGGLGAPAGGLAPAPAPAGDLAAAPEVGTAPEEEMQSTSACPEGEILAAEDEACPPETTGSLPDQESDEAVTAQTDELQDEATELVAAAGGKFIEEQGDDAILASELVGLTVYNPADEALGDVNDIVWTGDGGVEAVVVGVGGFLGVGEKQVAVAYSAVDISTDENGNKKLVLNATEDELAAAPAFVTTAQKLAMLRAEQERALPPGQGGGMVPAPALEPAPAQ